MKLVLTRNVKCLSVSLDQYELPVWLWEHLSSGEPLLIVGNFVLISHAEKIQCCVVIAKGEVKYFADFNEDGTIQRNFDSAAHDRARGRWYDEL